MANFIPLTISNASSAGWPRIAIIGDTAGIFWALGEMAALEANIYLCDTGIERPMREFPVKVKKDSDKANVYYNFFEDLKTAKTEAATELKTMNIIVLTKSAAAKLKVI